MKRVEFIIPYVMVAAFAVTAGKVCTCVKDVRDYSFVDDMVHDMQRHDDTLVKFEDPYMRCEFMLDSVLPTKYPVLLENLPAYKDELLYKFVTNPGDSVDDLDPFPSHDLLHLLYLLPLEDYVSIVRDATTYFKEGQLRYDWYEELLFQDQFFSVSLQCNNNSTIVQRLIDEIRRDDKLLSMVAQHSSLVTFLDRLEHLLTYQVGFAADQNADDFNAWYSAQPPFLDMYCYVDGKIIKQYMCFEDYLRERRAAYDAFLNGLHNKR